MTNESVAADQLKSLIDRIEQLEREKADTQADIKDVYLEAKSSGFDTKAIRAIIKIRKKDWSELKQEEAMLELYREALGMPA